MVRLNADGSITMKSLEWYCAFLTKHESKSGLVARTLLLQGSLFSLAHLFEQLRNGDCGPSSETDWILQVQIGLKLRPVREIFAQAGQVQKDLQNTVHIARVAEIHETHARG